MSSSPTEECSCDRGQPHGNKGLARQKEAVTATMEQRTGLGTHGHNEDGVHAVTYRCHRKQLVLLVALPTRSTRCQCAYQCEAARQNSLNLAKPALSTYCVFANSTSVCTRQYAFGVPHCGLFSQNSATLWREPRKFNGKMPLCCDWQDMQQASETKKKIIPGHSRRHALCFLPPRVNAADRLLDFGEAVLDWVGVAANEGSGRGKGGTQHVVTTIECAEGG